MKKTIINHFILTVSLYAFAYLVTTFIIWDIRNPFQWIINLPQYDYESRFCILFGYLFYTIISILLFPENSKNEKT